MKEIRLYVLTGLAIFLLNSCASYKSERIIGNYESQWAFTRHRLKLFNDNSFIFYISEELFQDTIYGRWEINRNQILLMGNEYKSYYTINECKTCNAYNLATFDSKTKEGIPLFYKAFNDGILKNEGYTDLHGKASLSEKIDSLYLESLEYEPLGFKVADTISYIEVFLLKRMNNEILKYKWTLRGNEIIGSNGLVLKKVPDVP